LFIFSLSTKMQHNVSFLVKNISWLCFAFKFPNCLFYNVTKFLEKQIYLAVSFYSLPNSIIGLS
jgi:hypothetical protein